MKIELVAHDYHRNGICGAPFEPCIFNWKDDDGRDRRMLGILWDDDDMDGCAVLDIDMAAEGNIEFMANSWRGDHFSTALRDAIRKAAE